MTNLVAAVLLLPLLGFIILGLAGRGMSRPQVLAIGIGSCGLAFLFTLISFLSMLGTPVTGGARVSDAISYTWIISGNSGNLNDPLASLQINFGLLFDQLSAIMLLIITGVGLLIHIYSAGYMEDDPGFWRFFAYLNFFIFAMVLLVTADNFLFLLIGWGLVGLASFLLIGFWFQRRSAVAASMKALVLNVIGDFGMMLAIFLIFKSYGPTLNFHDVFTNAAKAPVDTGTLTAICLLLFVACAAKSAQLPLYMWLPDAMEGPTPVSALIHAATMVTAGVYLVARVSPLYELAPAALNVVVIIGGATALFAATIALFQLDIKRVLAYSTISQLGYMFMSEGVHNYDGGIFHVLTHAFFKALLFLGAGAVIHALSGEQDMRQMGGLRRKLPITYWTFLIAALAISGIFPFAGFWSKDDILGSLLNQAMTTGEPGYYVLWAVGLLTAGLTAFYMFRLFFGIFLGNYRGGQQVSAAHEEDVEEEATGHHAGKVSYYDIHEVPPVMSVPLLILAVLSTIGGFVGSFALFNKASYSPLVNFLSPAGVNVGPLPVPPEPSFNVIWISTGISLGLALLGILGAWAFYRRGFEYKERKNPLYQLVYHKYYVDEILNAIIVKPVLAFGRAASHWLEGDALDGGSRGVAFVTKGTSSILRRLQTGYMRNYALGIMLGAVLIVVFYIVYYSVRG